MKITVNLLGLEPNPESLGFAASIAERYRLSYLDVSCLMKYQLLQAPDFLAAPIRRWSKSAFPRPITAARGALL